MALYLVTIERKARYVVEVADCLYGVPARETAIAEAETAFGGSDDAECLELDNAQSCGLEKLVPQPA